MGSRRYSTRKGAQQRGFNVWHEFVDKKSLCSITKTTTRRIQIHTSFRASRSSWLLQASRSFFARLLLPRQPILSMKTRGMRPLVSSPFSLRFLGEKSGSSRLESPHSTEGKAQSYIRHYIPVAPYANTVTLMPSSSSAMCGLAVPSYTSACPASGGNTASNEYSFADPCDNTRQARLVGAQTSSAHRGRKAGRNASRQGSRWGQTLNEPATHPRRRVARR